MKLLLDENLPHQLRFEIPDHVCFTVTYMGWSGVKNGELLNLARAEGFDAFLTKDAGIQYEQNLSLLPIAVVILQAPSNDIEDIRPLLPLLLATMHNLQPRQLVRLP
jgi:predicted nuclease of predicted toxin-antitoxin system